MIFTSDNSAAAAAEILASLAAVNEAHAPAYGEDRWSRELNEAFSTVFEADVQAFLVASGTAANAIALACLTPPWGAVICHPEAHVAMDEAGAPEFYSGGAKLVLAEGEHAKLTPRAIETAAGRYGRGVHSVLPRAVSISQTSERGACYGPEEIAAIAKASRAHGLALHMDGARFANAVAALGAAPADLSWRNGVDLLSFGATKNGALGAEAILCFDPARADEIARRRKRGGHLLCKSRFVAAQFLAYLRDGLWLRLAARANALAQRLGEAAGPLLSTPVQSNQVFIRPGASGIETLRAAGAQFYDWGPGEARLVVSWNQAERDIEAMAGLLAVLVRGSASSG